MTSTEIKDEFEEKYGKLITQELMNMHLAQIVSGDMKNLGDNPIGFINLLLRAVEYLYEKID